MIIETTRLGPTEIDESQAIHFPRGIPGFPKFKRAIMMNEASYFHWLQSLDDPDLAFVITSPSLHFRDYQPALRPEQLGELGSGIVLLFVIVNKVDGSLTANLQAPLAVNLTTRRATQIILSEKQYQTRHPLPRAEVAA